MKMLKNIVLALLIGGLVYQLYQLFQPIEQPNLSDDDDDAIYDEIYDDLGDW